MEFLPFSNSSANQVSWNSSAALPIEEPYTDDGWSFREVKLFEKTLAEFRGVASLAFFAEAARRLHWRDMRSIMQHYEMLMTDLKLIEDGKVDDLVHMDEDGSSAHVEPKIPVVEKEQKKCTPWTPEEHRLFLMGLNEYGKGKWKKICQKYVTTKTPAQVASHAQKFFRRDFCKTPVAKRRRSINDIRFVTPVAAENLAQTYSHVVPPPPQVFPNNFYSVANGVDETILGHQLMTHPGINQQYI